MGNFHYVDMIILSVTILALLVKLQLCIELPPNPGGLDTKLQLNIGTGPRTHLSEQNSIHLPHLSTPEMKLVSLEPGQRCFMQKPTKGPFH